MCAHVWASLRVLVRWGKDQASFKTVRGVAVLPLVVWSFTMHIKVVRRSSRQKPDIFLRRQPMLEVVEALAALRDVIVFSPDPVCGEGALIYCYCGAPATHQMVQCDGCQEWFHFKCAGVRAANVKGDVDYQCGYCRGDVDNDGKQVWEGEVLRGRKHVHTVVIPPRDPNHTPAKRGKKTAGPREWFGPRNWDALVEEIRAHAADVQKKVEKQVKAAEGLAGGGGHHVGDHVVAGRLEAREITPDLLDELVVLGDIDDGDDDD